MRIALVSQAYPPSHAGGIASQTRLKARGLAARGHEVHVITHGAARATEPVLDGVARVWTVGGGDERLTLHTDAARWLMHSAAVAGMVAAVQARAPLDLVEFAEYGAEGYLHLVNRTEWNHVPTVIQLHGPLVMFAHTMGWPEIDSEFYRLGTMMEAACLRLADAVYSSSACSAEWCAKYYGANRARIPTLHAGVDLRHFRPRAVAKAAAPTIIFVGKIVGNKGVGPLLAAALELARERPGLRVRMLGPGAPAQIQALRARAAAAGFPELVELPGRVSPDELPDHLSRAHVFAAPSVYEGGPGFVYLEAMACGLPVIACAGSGASEAVRDGETGLLVPPHDVGALTAALRRLLGDAALRATLGAQARAFVEREADSEQCLAKLEAFYAQVAGRTNA